MSCSSPLHQISPGEHLHQERPPPQQQQPRLDVDIEHAHEIACRNLQTTYNDPHKPELLVFSEIAHLKRGRCCGNKCRHCPYGWQNVPAQKRLLNDEELLPRAKVASNDFAAIDALLNQYKNQRQQGGEDDSWQKHERLLEKQRAEPLPASTVTTATEDDDDDDDSDYTDSDSDDEQEDSKGSGRQEEANLKEIAGRTTTGGRKGGMNTKKNVPYTRGGDKGTSVLFTGQRKSKQDPVFAAMGDIDELCSCVGVVHAELLVLLQQQQQQQPADLHPQNQWLEETLLDIMSRLFDIGALLASSPSSKKGKDEDQEEDVLDVQVLETWIDDMTDDLPELHNFILPTGTRASALLHVARTVCRRAERSLVALFDDTEDTGTAVNPHPNILPYVNRLSDVFFTMARYVNYHNGHRNEILYRHQATTSSGTQQLDKAAARRRRQRVVLHHDPIEEQEEKKEIK